jgi:hypothetical protein
MRYSGHVPLTGQRGQHTGFRWANQKGREGVSRRWKDNIKIHHTQLVGGDMDWIHPAQD